MILKRILLSAAAAGMICGPIQTNPAHAYGGEDVLRGDPWHHEDITCRALIGDARCYDAAGANIVYGDAALGFSNHAAHAIAWHADYIDSYLYSPIWWASAGRPLEVLDRFKAGMANYWHLASLHFDDLKSTEEVEATWKRYMAGTLIGLHWAAEQEDINAAYNILGVSMHAVEDFYSHSTWINETQRRKRIYMDYTRDERARMTLMTGAYEREIAPVQHGKYNLACSVLNNDRAPLKGAMRTVCSDFFPTSNMGMCEKFRECEQRPGVQTRVEIVGWPADIAQLVPPGIAMDTTWLARVGADQRGLTQNYGEAISRDTAGVIARAGRLGRVLDNVDLGAVDLSAPPPEPTEAELADPRENCRRITRHGADCARESDYLFAESKNLAVVAARQWVRMIDKHMTAYDPDFWAQVKQCGGEGCAQNFSYRNPPSKITRQFENYTAFPFQFISAGHHEPVADPLQDGWYLRVELKTSNDRGSGTGADIYVRGPTETYRSGSVTVRDRKQYLLDYLPVIDPDSPVRNPAITYNDFERGDRAVYTVGPFQEMPTELVLFNDAASKKDRREALKRKIKEKFKAVWDGARHALRNDQDYVGYAEWTPTRIELDSVIANGHTDSRGERTAPGFANVIVEGGDEGVYRFTLKVEKTPWRGTDLESAWGEYRMTLTEARVLRESTVDGVTRTDEPFFFTSLSTYGVNPNENVRFGPFSDIGTDRGDTRTMPLNHGFRTFRLPVQGVAAFVVEAWESDKERGRDRDELFRNFATGATKASESDYREYLYELGREIGAAWKLGGAKVYAFKRGDRPQYGKVFENDRLSLSVGEDREISLPLSAGAVKEIGVCLDNYPLMGGVDCMRLAPGGIKAPAPMLREEEKKKQPPLEIAPKKPVLTRPAPIKPKESD
jgi:hypothetical protein